MTYTELKVRYALMNYRFREEPMALNIGGFRSPNSRSNHFDDVIFVAWKEPENKILKPKILVFPGTTDPGKYWLENPMKKEGTIILVPGQYQDVYAKGLHAGKYDAFKQIKKMAYVRDNSRDTELDFSLYRDPEKRKVSLFWGINGTNLHRASEWKIIQLVEKYSAGCQVIQNPAHFKMLLELRDKSIAAGFNTFDYTLFEQ